MERLTTEQIADMKEYFSRSKEVKTSSLAMKLSHDGLKLIDTIEAQQQEIERLNKVLDDWKYNAKCDADHIATLIADKDELAGRLMQYDTGIKQAIKWLTPHPSDGSRAVEKARLHLIALIGGKEE